MQQIPLTTYPNQTFRIVLDDQDVGFSFSFAHVAQMWDFNLSVEGVEVLTGQRLVLGTDLLRAHNFGIGALIAYATADRGHEAARSDLGSRVMLLHLTEEEVEAAAA